MVIQMCGMVGRNRIGTSNRFQVDKVDSHGGIMYTGVAGGDWVHHFKFLVVGSSFVICIVELIYEEKRMIC